MEKGGKERGMLLKGWLSPLNDTSLTFGSKEIFANMPELHFLKMNTVA